MELKPDSSLDEITRVYNLHSDESEVKEAYNCLSKSECRAEYTRYGSGLQLNDAAVDFKFDWRLSFTVAFYMLFAFV